MARNWIILRCSSAATIDLAKGLQEQDVTAWTPVELVNPRPRNGKRRDKEERPILPSYVFADAVHTTQLLDMMRRPALGYRQWDSEKRKFVNKGVPHFRIHREFDRVPTVPDVQLSYFRMLDRRRKAIAPVRAVKPGLAFRLADGGFAGLDGKVDDVEGKYLLVTFEGFPQQVKIPAWIVSEALDANGQHGVECAQQASSAVAEPRKRVA